MNSLRPSLLIVAALLGAGLAVPVSAQTPHQPPDWEYWHHEGGFTNSENNPAALTDGNPASATARVQHTIVQDAALPAPEASVADFPEMAAETAADQPAPSPAAEGGWTGIDLYIGHGSYTAGDTDGEVSSVAIPANYKVNERLSLKASIPIYYVTVKGVDFASLPPGDVDLWGAGLILSAPYGIYIAQDDRPYRWRVTPSLGLSMEDASDLDTGVWTISAGVSSSFLYKLGERVILNVGNSLVHHEMAELKSGYADLGQSGQQLFVNGLQLIFPSGRWVFNLYAMDSRFLQDAAVDNYQTYGAGAGYRIGKKTSLRLFASTDQGDDYQSFSVSLSSSWKF